MAYMPQLPFEAKDFDDARLTVDDGLISVQEHGGQHAGGSTASMAYNTATLKLLTAWCLRELKAREQV